jgi:hypothetical protein
LTLLLPDEWSIAYSTPLASAMASKNAAKIRMVECIG